MAMFTEFQNANSLRRYPFAQYASLVSDNGVAIDSDTLVDACIHSPGTKSAYISRISASLREIEVSDADTLTPIMVGTVGSFNQVDLYSIPTDESQRKQILGTLVLGKPPEVVLASAGESTYEPAATTLDPACIIPLRRNGVTSVTIHADNTETGLRVEDAIEFSATTGNGEISAILSEDTADDGASVATLRFDALPQLPGLEGSGVKVIVFECASKYFSVYPLNENSVWVTLSDITREDICAMVHAHDSVRSLSSNDYCENPHPTGEGVAPVPRLPCHDMFAIDISKANSKNLVISVADGLNYANPLYVRMTSGAATVSPASQVATDNVAELEAKVASGEGVATTTIDGNAVELGIMGM